MDPLSLTAGVIAVVGLADQVIKLCHGYIQSVENFPRDIRMILIEISALKDIFQNLLFLSEHDAHCSAMLTSLLGQDGPISACRASMASLELCLRHERVDSANKRRRLKLSLESLAWNFKETRVRQAMDEIRRYKETITLAFSSEVMQDIKDVKRSVSKIELALTDSQLQKVYKWLRHVDPSPNHNAARDLYEADTGNWVLRDPEWIAWMRLQRRCLWIHGIPGAGKTILASHLIEQINETISHSQEPDRPVASVYYYCYYGRNQDERDPLLWWMLDQLCRHLQSVPCSVKRIYDHGRQPATRELLECLEELLTAVHAVYLVVDAVDESLERHNLLETLRHFCTKPEFARLQVLVTSREYVDIARVLTPISQPLSMANPQVSEDIKSYTQSRLETDRQFRRWSSSLREEVKNVVSSGAKGMFRWAACQLDILRRLNANAEIRQALKTLPESLDATYIRILGSVDEVLRPFLRFTVRWIIFLQPIAFSPIQIAQAYAASVETDSDQSYTMSGNMQGFVDTFLEACGCLVTHHKNSWNVDRSQLAHFTVFEFLRSSRITGTTAQYFAILPNDLFLDFRYLILKTAVGAGKNHLPVIDQILGFLGDFSCIPFPLCQPLQYLKMVEDAAVDEIISMLLKSPKTKLSTAVFTLFQILFLYRRDHRAKELGELAISGLEIHDVLNTPIKVAHRRDPNSEFQGTILEIMSYVHVNSGPCHICGCFDFLLRLGANHMHFTPAFSYMAVANMFRSQSLPPLNVCYNEDRKTLEDDRKALLNCQDAWLTPLQLATSNADIEALEILLNHGADPDIIGSAPQRIAGVENPHLLWLYKCHGLSPLEIADYPLPLEPDREVIIKSLLIHHGAKRIARPGNPLREDG